VLRAWQGGGISLSSYPHGRPPEQGAQIGAEASTNKIVWSELDIMIHETAMRILGARASSSMTPRPTNGWKVSVLAGRSHLRGQQRDPAQHHRSAHAGPAQILIGRETTMDFTFTEDQIAFRDSISRFLMTEAAPELLRDIWETPTGRSPSCGPRLQNKA
jgi:hypothetical protein